MTSPRGCPECDKVFDWGADDDSAIVDQQGEKWHSCRENAFWKLHFHFQAEHADKGMRCGRRAGTIRAADPDVDFWEVEPNGDRTCSYCGSLHPDDFTEIIEGYAEGKEGFHFDLSTKAYKRYAHRPGVKNATEGGIKFYAHHLPDEGAPELQRLREAEGRAVERARAELERLSNPSSVH